MAKHWSIATQSGLCSQVAQSVAHGPFNAHDVQAEHVDVCEHWAPELLELEVLELELELLELELLELELLELELLEAEQQAMTALSAQGRTAAPRDLDGIATTLPRSPSGRPAPTRRAARSARVPILARRHA